MKIRAAVLTSPMPEGPYAQLRPLEVCDLDLAPPREGELLVRIQAAGVCHSDLSVVNGTRVRPVPMALGHECAGTVVESRARGIREGDHVILTFVPRCGRCSNCSSSRPWLCDKAAASNGAGELLAGGTRLSLDGKEIKHHLGVSAFAEFAVVDQGSVIVIPREVPLEVAALFGCAVMTGAGAVFNTARVSSGQCVAVWGLGGVGMSAVMAAVSVGADRVIAIDPDPAKRRLAEDVGATTTLSPDEPLLDAVPRGVDAAIEAAGSVAALTAAFGATARGGVTVSVGLPDPAAIMEISPLQLVAESRTLAGSYLGSCDPTRDVPKLIELWQDGRLPVEKLRTGDIGLDDINEALDELDAGRVVRQMIRFDGV